MEDEKKESESELDAAETAATGASDVDVWVIDDDAEASGEPPGAADGSEVGRLRKEIAEVRDQWVRTLADLDNYRKRSERELREAKRFALFEPMRDLVAVVDNLERAMSAGGSAEDVKRGVQMILAQLREVMRSHGVKEISTTGSPFDPAIHDAIARFEDAGTDVPTVAEELQRGYTIHERLLRPALVKVAMPLSSPGNGGTAHGGPTSSGTGNGSPFPENQ